MQILDLQDVLETWAFWRRRRVSVVRPGSPDTLPGSGDDLEEPATRGVSRQSWVKTNELGWIAPELKA